MTLRFDVFGREVHVRRADRGWQAFYPGTDGKARLAHDIRIPAHMDESSLGEYLFSLCHEWATPARSEVRLLGDDSGSGGTT